MNKRLPLLLVLTLAMTLLVPIAARAKTPKSQRIGVYGLGMRPMHLRPLDQEGNAVTLGEKVDKAIEAAATTELHNADELANAFKYLDNVTKNKSALCTGLGKACDVLSFSLATAKVLQAQQQDKHSQIKRASHTAVKEYTKWGVGTVVGGLVAGAVMTIGVSNPFTAIMVATYAAWGTTTVVENTIDRVAVTYFDPLHETKRDGPLDPRMVQWLGARTKSGMTLDIQSKHLEVRPTFIPENMLPTQASQILSTAQQNCMTRAGELLDLGPAPFGPLRKNLKKVTIDDLANRLPSSIITEEDLRDFVKGRAREVVYEDGSGHLTGETTPELQHKAYVDRAYPYLHRAWLERRARLERMLQRLKHQFETTALDLTISPENPEIDPKTGKAVIHFTLGEQSIRELLTKIRRVERLLTGKEPTATCKINWSGKSKHGKISQSAEWPKGCKWWTQVTKPGWVDFSYKVTITMGRASGERLEITTSDNIPIEVTGEELVTRTFAGTHMDTDDIGKLQITIRGTEVQGMTDTRFSPPDRTAEMQHNQDVGNIGSNAVIVLSEAFRGLRNVIQYRGTFDPATSTIRGTVTSRRGMKDGPLGAASSGTFRGKVQGNTLSITFSIPDPKGKNPPWVKSFKLREKPTKK